VKEKMAREKRREREGERERKEMGGRKTYKPMKIS
jgi:hypothetical protein